MNPQDELRELLGQATEYLRYFREIGITHIGETAPPESRTISATNVDAVALPTPPAVVQSDLVPPPTIPNPTISMPIKKEASSLFDEPALFGEPAAAPVQETLEAIRAEMGDCHRCKLGATRTKLVFGEGSPEARLMFIGEGPGADEDASGRPFVGRAGQLLTKMIEAINLKREDVYIANVVKSRPPGNRTPETDEVRACIPFLFRQIASIKPKLIVALGNPAMQALLDTKIGITKMRGQFAVYPRDPQIKVLPTFHPAYLLRSPDKKREAWEDLKKVRAFLAGEIEG